MTNRKPVPLFDQAPRPLCPVCGKTSYSVAGIHPQCSVQLIDDERMRLVRLAIAQGQQQKVPPTRDTRPGQRLCPDCLEVQHVRQENCSCGHVFVALSNASSLKGEDS